MNLDDLFESEYPRILNYLRRKLGHNSDHADDLAQVVFEKYFLTKKKCPPKDPSAWLMKVAHNDCMQFFREKKRNRHLISECDLVEVFKNSRIPIRSLDDLPPPEPPPFVIPGSEKWEPWTQHLDTLAEFKENERAALVLFHPDILGRQFEAWAMRLFKTRMAKRIIKANDEWPGGTPVKDIARLLSLPEGTVRSHLSRVRAKLKPLFTKHILEQRAKRGSAIRYPKEFRVSPFAPILATTPSFTDPSDHARKFIQIMPKRDLPEPRSKPPAYITSASSGKRTRRTGT